MTQELTPEFVDKLIAAIRRRGVRKAQDTLLTAYIEARRVLSADQAVDAIVEFEHAAAERAATARSLGLLSDPTASDRHRYLSVQELAEMYPDQSVENGPSAKNPEGDPQ